MPGIRSRFTAIRSARRQRSFAPRAMLVGITGLAVTGVIALSVIVATVASSFAGGLVLGAGAVITAWAVSRSTHRLSARREGIPGRSHTLDCRSSRWDRQVAFNGQPHPPAPADRRIRPCPGSRHR